MKALINLIQKIDAKHLFFAGGISAASGLASTVLSGSSFAIWLLVICVVSALIFFALIATKMAYGLLNSIVTTVKRPRTRNTGKSKRNIPLIIVGLITLIAISSLRAQLGGGVAVSIIQVCALVIILYGFGMSWTRKGMSANNKSSSATDTTELVKVWSDVIEGNKTWGWQPIIAALVHINQIPIDVVNVAEKTNGSRWNKFPQQHNGYNGVLWIARDKDTYMLVFSPVFSSITDKKYWQNTPLMLCPDLERWLDLKDAAEKRLIINDNTKMTPLTDDKDFSILTALLKTKHYKDIG